jgi:hypothetical protein
MIQVTDVLEQLVRYHSIPQLRALTLARIYHTTISHGHNEKSVARAILRAEGHKCTEETCHEGSA